MRLFVFARSNYVVHSIIINLLIICHFLLSPTESSGFSSGGQRYFEKRIIDYREHLNPLFIKTKRNSTRYIIVHTSECDLKTTLKYKANHAGLSMWNSETNLNNSPIGIELVGYHNKEITVSQYKSIRWLIDLLKNMYQLDNLAVLTHSQVAYAQPNLQIPFKHRGRKNCARNILIE